MSRFNGMNVRALAVLAGALLVSLPAFRAEAQATAGFSEYIIPGNEGQVTETGASSTQLGLYYVFNQLDTGGTPTSANMHTVITVTAWAPNTAVYYDHWEDGLDFDPNNPTTADETVSLATMGALRNFESTNFAIPVAATTPGTGCNTVGTCVYDGGDRIFVAGGAVTVTRAGWNEERGVGNQAVAWEIYPVRPQLTTYVVPFGENLGIDAFERVFVLIQATADGTTFQVDVDASGSFDLLNADRDATKSVGDGDTDTVTLDAGQTFLLDAISACPTGTACTTTPGVTNQILTGALIQGSSTLQVKYIAGNNNSNYCARGLSSFPRGYWTKSYYAPLDQRTTNGTGTDYILHNPHGSSLLVTWESRTASGSFSIPARSTVRYGAQAGAVLPVDSGLYFSAPDVFWGVGLGDWNGAAYEWGYSLLPSTFLSAEHFLGWAPGFVGGSGIARYDDVGVFLVAAQDNTTIFVDFNSDGNADQTYTLNRLQSQFIFDPNDGNLTGAHIWGTGEFTLAYGENADTASTSTPSLDLGYVGIPGTDFLSLVLGVEKTANPQVVGTAAGSTTEFTIVTGTQEYALDGLEVVDTLPPGWEYVSGSTTITRPDLTTSNADPATITGTGTLADPYVLTWLTADLAPSGMAPNQQVSVKFTAETTAALAVGTLSRNRVVATGSRTVGSPSVTQTFSATDFTYVATGDLQISKTSSAPTPLYPGDTFTYTVTVTNPAGGVTQTGVSLYDALPAGVTVVSGTPTLSRSTVADSFNSASYTLNVGTRNWTGGWFEELSGDGNPGNPASGEIQITGGELRLNNDNASGSTQNNRISRDVDLSPSGAPSAFLAFRYRTSSAVDAGDDVRVEYSSDGGGSFTTLATFSGAGSGTAALTVPVANLRIRFIFPDISDYGDADEFFFVDDLSITFDQSVSTIPPPGLASASSLYALAPGQSLTATFDVTVDDPFPTGSNLITNTAATTTVQFPIQITASVTDQVTVPTLLSATVAGRVWFDADGDGVQDLGEPGISNVQVTLKDQFGTPVATLTTDVNGRYLFTGVTPGNGYYVEVQSGLPAGVQQSFPVGRSDNRTGSFNLAAGQNFTGADLGYEPLPATVSFGDLVWVDADGDGVRDAGEVGLGGVTVSLYRDTNGDGFLQPGTDELVTTTTSASDGSYLFAGQTPGPTYFVSATTPGGFTSTGDTVYRFTSTTAGTAYLTADFGFVGTTYTLSDRIWNDADQDGVFDAGENGIAGVTVEILDASLNVIGLTTTAADGTFTFSGLPGSGANYTTRISDTGGVLTNFTGTTPYALARLRSEPNLVADRDRTATPSYGFFAARSIGDTVFFDLDGNGVQDPGESGIAGIVVGLYSDLDNDGVIDPGEPLVGTLTTDAAGRYLFSGLSDGNYIVSVPPLTGYEYTGTGGAADSDPGTAGVQRQAVMTGGANVLDIDFGFQAQTPASVTGTIWNDGNRDGLIGGSEGRLAGVTVDILDGTTVVATVTTDAAGNYTFSGLAAGDYTIRVTDTAGVLNGFSTTYEATEGTTEPFDNEEDVTLDPGNNTGPRFGYAFPTPTWVSVARLGATAAGGVVTVEWETTQEVGAVGFDLYRLDPRTGGWVRVNESLLPALLGHPEGGTYAVQDRAAPLAGPLTYRLVEVDWQDARHEHGPYRVDELLTGAPSFEAYRRAPREVPLETRERVRAAERARDAATVAAPVGRAGRVKLLTKGSGVVYVDVDSLAGLLVMPRERLAEMVAGARVALRHRGALVPYIPAALGDGLYFYAEAVESPYTDENAYFLSVQWGLRMPSRAATTGGAPATSFPAEARGEVDRIPLPLLFQDPEADFYAWEDLFAGYAGYDTKSVTTTLQGVAGTGNPTLTVSLLGGSSTAAPADHHVRITWNGRDVGEAVWDGAVPHVVTIPLVPSDLLEGVNTLTVRALLGAGVSQSAVYLDSFHVTYDRLFRATGDQLSFPLEAGAEATVTGLGTSRLVVLDVTAPRSPVRVTGLTPFAAGDGTWSLRLANAGAEARSYVLLDPTRAALPAGLSLMASPELSSPSNRADYVLIAPTSLVATAETLADYRRSQGLETMVVDLEAVYDEFDHGLATPTAIRQFLAHAASTWSRPPQYATLVGRGTFDYRNVQGVGDNVMPTMLASTPYGLVASDVSFASVSSTPGPGLKAIGRIPVLTPQELADYVAKIQAHEGAPSGAWQNRLLLVADNADAGGSFNADSDAIGAIAPGSFQSTKVYLPAYNAAGARTAIRNAVNSGTLVFNYIGHGGPDRLAGENIFNKTDVPFLSNAGQLPVFLAMTCSTGNFAIPGFPSLAESLVLWKSGGAYVAWAPSGLSLNDGATVLNEAFFHGAFVDGEKVLGLLCTKSLEELDGGGPTGYMKAIYNLLGEPVSRLP